MNILDEENIDKSLSVHYLIYRIENTVNQKHYIGQHKTTNPYDDYMGSGFYLKSAQIKYGLSSFIKEILFDFDNFDSMNEKEKELVPLSSCYPYDKMSYNLKEGGHSGEMTEVSGKKISEAQKIAWKNKTPEERRIFSEKRSKATTGKNNPMYGKSILDMMSDDQIKEWRRKQSIKSKMLWKDEEYRKTILSRTLQKPGISHDCRKYMTDQEILKWKENLSKASSGENNPMYGKSSWEKCTPEQKADRIKRFSQSMKGKNKGKKCMKLPNEKRCIFVKPEDVQAYLNIGYEFYSRNKGKRFKKA